MVKMKYLFIVAVVVFFAMFKGNGFCSDAAENADSELERYQIYPMQNVILMLDTKTGKTWKVFSDMAGKYKAEGVTVEGIAYCSTDLESLSNKIKDIDLEGVAEKDKSHCREELVAQFSYNLDLEKIKKVLKIYKTKKD